MNKNKMELSIPEFILHITLLSIPLIELFVIMECVLTDGFWLDSHEDMIISLCAVLALIWIILFTVITIFTFIFKKVSDNKQFVVDVDTMCDIEIAKPDKEVVPIDIPKMLKKRRNFLNSYLNVGVKNSDFYHKPSCSELDSHSIDELIGLPKIIGDSSMFPCPICFKKSAVDTSSINNKAQFTSIKDEIKFLCSVYDIKYEFYRSVVYLTAKNSSWYFSSSAIPFTLNHKNHGDNNKEGFHAQNKSFNNLPELFDYILIYEYEYSVGKSKQ